MVKSLPANVGDMGSVRESGRSPGEGNGNPLQYYCLRNPTTEEPGRLQSMGSQKSWAPLSTHFSLSPVCGLLPVITNDVKHLFMCFSTMYPFQ